MCFADSVVKHIVCSFFLLFSSRIFREKQYAERRLKDFDDALTREAVRGYLIYLSYITPIPLRPPFEKQEIKTI